MLRDLKNKNIDHIYQYEDISIKQSLEEDKTSIYDKYVCKLEQEIKQLEENRRQFLLDYNWYQLMANGASIDELNQDQNELLGSTRNQSEIDDDLEELRKLTGKSSGSNDEKKDNENSSSSSQLSPVLLQGTPYIVYSLQDYEILEDLFVIKMHNNIKGISGSSSAAKYAV